VAPKHDTVDDTVDQAQRGTTNKDASADDEAEELDGKMKRDFREQKLMHTVLQADKDTIENGKQVREAANQNVGAFTPEMAFEKIVNNYREAERLMGDTMLRELTGYDSDYIERNVNIPEFQRELRQRIKQNVDELRSQDVVGEDGQVTPKGYDLAALNLIEEELDDLDGSGWLGDKRSDERFHTGETKGYKRYTSSQPYRDVSTRRTIKVAARRGQQTIRPQDLRLKNRRAEGGVELVFCVDVSGSMTGSKIDAAKRAGVGLAYQAETSNDDVGMVFFANDVEGAAPIGSDVVTVARSLVEVSPQGETDLSVGLSAALSLFSSSSQRDQHILLLTDALQTKGETPDDAVIPAVERARSQGVGVSVLGVDLDENGRRLAESIVDVADGTLYFVGKDENTDRVAIEALDDLS
jgi:magnesium chelatase subunit I